MSDIKQIAEELRQSFPYGHPEFLPMLLEKMKLHSDKNHDYAKGGTPLGNFERVANIFAQYPGLQLSDPVVVMLAYAMKQIDAVLWGFAQGITHKVEGPVERLGDVLVYAGIAICALKDRAAEAEFDRLILQPPHPPTQAEREDIFKEPEPRQRVQSQKEARHVHELRGRLPHDVD